MLNQKQKLIPIVVAIGLFLLLSIIYMSPVLEGKLLNQSDVVQHLGMSKELVDYRTQTGEEALWTNSMFGGMPGYLISTNFNGNKLRTIHRILMLHNWRPICFMFLFMLGFYLMLLAFQVNPWLSIVGAIAYAFSSFFLISIGVGHISKILALGYMPPIIGGVHLAFRGKYLWGAIMTGIALGLQIFVVHLQITYYTFIILLIYGAFELVYAIIEKRVIAFSKAVGVLVIAVLLAIGSNFASLWTTYEYGKYSTRSKSDLTIGKDNKTSGLDKDYATDWSYGIGETFTLLVPNFKGGPSVGEIPVNSSTYKLLSSPQYMGKAKAREAVKQMPTYFGTQPSTAGPVYAGAIICFLFLLGMFMLENKHRWWLLTATIVSIVFSWGKNIPGFTGFLLDYLPGYNKFRAVSMNLVIAEFTLPLLAILSIDKLIKGEIDIKRFRKALLISSSIAGGLLLIIIAFAGQFNFDSPRDQQYLEKGYTELVDALHSDRLMMLRRDAFRSFVYIFLAASVIFMFLKKKVTQTQAIAALGVLIIFDMWAIDKRYLNNDSFVPKREFKNVIAATDADKFILQDPSKDYRVINLSADIFNDATTSYFHKSIGGYHGAKMRRYQELIENCIYPELQTLVEGLKTTGLQSFNQSTLNLGVLNMLNTKYLIYDPAAPPLLNANANGNAWFVDKVELVNNADEEIVKLGSSNTKQIALVDKQFESFLKDKTFIPDTNARVTLEEYKPNYLKYSTSSANEGVAVFSEIYYAKGWDATIDGKPAEYFRADYVLRSMVIPAGNHTIEFKFEPKSYFIGEKISLASSLLFILLLLGGIGYEIKKIVDKKKKA